MTGRRRSLDGLDEDIRDHIERETQDNIDRGMSPADARDAALRAFGNVTLAMEDTREVWVPVRRTSANGFPATARSPAIARRSASFASVRQERESR